MKKLKPSAKLQIFNTFFLFQILQNQFRKLNVNQVFQFDFITTNRQLTILCCFTFTYITFAQAKKPHLKSTMTGTS